MAKRKTTVEAASGTSRPAGTRTASATTTAAPGLATAPRVSREQIAKRAYEIWIAKGRPAGRDLENWQQAERELGARR